LRALVFDSIYDSYRGVIAYMRVVDGSIRAREPIKFMIAGVEAEADEIGIMSPDATPVKSLETGEVGYLIAGIKEVSLAKVGDTVTAKIASDVKDASGRVVIPAGSQVTLQITAIKESENKSDTTGTLTLQPTSVNINGKSYPLAASIRGVTTKLEGRKTNAGDIAKPAGGAAAGAILGRVIGGSTKGAIIGGVIGGAVGAQRAVETKDRDVVLPQGTSVTLVLDESFRTAT
jgi:hypothetical protein